MSYTLYDKKTNSIIGIVSNPQDYPGASFVKGNYDTNDYVVVDGEFVRKAKMPSTKASWHVYTYKHSTNSYELDIPGTSNNAKRLRKELLKNVDKVNPIWLASMNAVQQLQVANYRQDLLDITKQENYPVDIVWPVVPYFLK